MDGIDDKCGLKTGTGSLILYPQTNLRFQVPSPCASCLRTQPRCASLFWADVCRLRWFSQITQDFCVAELTMHEHRCYWVNVRLVKGYPVHPVNPVENMWSTIFLCVLSGLRGESICVQVFFSVW